MHLSIRVETKIERSHAGDTTTPPPLRSSERETYGAFIEHFRHKFDKEQETTNKSNITNIDKVLKPNPSHICRKNVVVASFFSDFTPSSSSSSSRENSIDNHSSAPTQLAGKHDLSRSLTVLASPPPSATETCHHHQPNHNSASLSIPPTTTTLTVTPLLKIARRKN
ncbi:hypothetical protein LXL04_011694 [Taraxacum kok-saghyz]